MEVFVIAEAVVGSDEGLTGLGPTLLWVKRRRGLEEEVIVVVEAVTTREAVPLREAVTTIIREATMREATGIEEKIAKEGSLREREAEVHSEAGAGEEGEEAASMTGMRTKRGLRSGLPSLSSRGAEEDGGQGVVSGAGSSAGRRGKGGMSQERIGESIERRGESTERREESIEEEDGAGSVEGEAERQEAKTGSGTLDPGTTCSGSRKRASGTPEEEALPGRSAAKGETVGSTISTGRRRRKPNESNRGIDTKNQ